MTLEESEQLKPEDAVTRNGETGTVKSFHVGHEPGQGLMMTVEWASGRQGTVGYREVERA